MTQPDSTNLLAGCLRQHGLRATPQRALILQVLQQSDEHLDAESLWQRAHEQDASVNLATVYRTLKSLVEAGLIQQSFLGGEQKRAMYEAVNKPEHVHFTCLRCGKVLELDGEQFAHARPALESHTGVSILRMQLKLEGLCRECNISTVAEANP